jgi:hypothetical protein
MPAIEREIYRIINSANTSVKRGKDNETLVQDSKKFKGLAVSKIDSITHMLDSYIKETIEQKTGMRHTSLQQLQSHSKNIVLDTARLLAQGKKASFVRDSIYNPNTRVNVQGDPTIQGVTEPNIWLSPYEANSMYSQKGLPEVIINKKSKAILLNGLKIKNAKLSARQIDAISLNMLSLDIPKIISDAVRDSLVYGGAITFPMFKHDNPMTAGLSVVALIKQGILKKGSIDRIVSLDRWNVVHVPATNPTQKDFLLPEKYYIPFLGSDVHGSRCSRIVTATQAGYFGQIMTMGWGLSDMCGYIREVINYKNAIQTLPMMIQQMSILARTINLDGVLATEGANIMDALLESESIRISEWSPNNPITMDMLGDLKVINRDFAEVPSLLRLLRQDLAASATLPEPMLFSSEKGNFASGDDTQGNLTKQYEAVKFIHKDVESQFKQLAKILIINALGATQEVLEALPYTEIHFDVPMVANSTERAEIGLNIAKTFFELVSGQMPLDEAAKIASGYGGDELSIDSELLGRLEQRQIESDAKQKEKFEKEMELMDAQIEQAKNPPETGFGGAKKPSLKKKKGDDAGYSRLEQEQHEKTKMPGEKTPEKLAKRAGK